MLIAKVFQSGNSQAIRIPKEAKTDQQEFFIRKIFPTDDPWYPLRESIGMIPEDFMEERSQPSWDNLPEREGL